MLQRKEVKKLAKELTLGSLFDGIGGFPYAASFYGIRTLWASEIQPECISVTRQHFPDMEHLGDITQIDGRKIAPVDIITFGSPCQGLSTAGLRRGLADERSGLFMEAIRIIYEMREATHGKYPTFAIWENVPGAANSAAGRDYQAVLSAFTKAEIPMPASGKWSNAGMVRSRDVDLAWVMYDAQHFGTAQRRRRLFLVCDFAGRCAGEILFVPKSLRGYFEAGGTPRQGLAAFAENSADTAGRNPDGIYCFSGNTIGRKEGAGGNGAGFQENISYTLTAADCHAVSVPTVTVRIRCGCEGGGKGPLLQVEKSGTLATGNDQYLFVPQTVEFPALRSQAHGNLPVVAAGFDLQQITSKTNRSTLRPVQPTLCGTGRAHVVAGTLCMATGQANAGVMKNQTPTLTAAHEQPVLVHPQIAGTLCASGAGLSRPAGMGSEADFCITSTGFRYKAAGTAGSVGYQKETAPTLAAGQPSGVFVSTVDCRNLRETEEVSGTLQAKTKSGGYSLNYTNPVRVGLHVRRLTPLECERLQGFPDFWTRYGHDGKGISDSKRYSMLGNSVAVPCVAYIMQGIREVMAK